jgi:hypothetical protein
MPVLLLLVVGIIDFGLWFSDSLAVRQGVRESARQAVVKTFDSTCTGTDIEKVVCATKKQVGPATGAAYAKVLVPAAGWKKGESLTVCAMVETDALTGLLPLPRVIRSETQMSIEIGHPPASGVTAGDTAPAGSDWTWCG